MMGGVPNIRVTNQLRAIGAREVRWINDQSYTRADGIKIGVILHRGPYKRWLSTR